MNRSAVRRGGLAAGAAAIAVAGMLTAGCGSNTEKPSTPSVSPTEKAVTNVPEQTAGRGPNSHAPNPRPKPTSNCGPDGHLCGDD